MSPQELFKGGGEMGERIRTLDWTQTQLGAVDTWPQSLITAVNIMLGSRFPMMVHWGPDLVHFYNDGYATILQGKHPGALGQPAEPWWREMWPFLLGIFGPVLAGETTYFENGLVLPNRQGFVEEAYFTFSHSPIYDEANRVGGIFVTALETTVTVLQQRRLALLSNLMAQTATSVLPAEAAQHIIAALATNPDDIPFALLYAHEPLAPHAQLRAWFGLPAGEPTAPATLLASPTAQSSAGWPLAEVFRSNGPVLVESLAERFGSWPAGAWPEPPTRALLLPLLTGASIDPTAVLIVGLSARRPLDEAYQTFFTLVADYAGRALARATTLYEAQRMNQALREANTSLDSFVHIVAHDLKGPVTNLQGLLEVHREEPSGTSRTYLMSLVEKEVQHLTGTIHGLLQVLYAQHNGAAAVPETVLLDDVFATVQAEVADLLFQQHGHLSADFSGAPTVYQPRIYLESILKNLVSNALKYRSPERAPIIEVRSYRQGGDVLLTVADNGRGIDLVRDRERLFQPFTRLTTEGEGAGLGLHMIQVLVQQRGGMLDVASTPGVGTIFTVILPAAALARVDAPVNVIDG
ncbi:HAMP domain-containing histidine kinase [Hymenobacter sp. DH14]|uniref:histidine kinase n=1 Tax=Hymenobacter cyanobacteriorum TaxID=2926463 RepID=A0A9X2AH07_9BACT|nr:GAF domain-containing sensor histidine kinase [Hymenobacter cyanobacteriorum]MCI1186279.1 HAMP domain-containing histidine kinase [Hymenobacter cyanobacteriorum]